MTTPYWWVLLTSPPEGVNVREVCDWDEQFVLDATSRFCRVEVGRPLIGLAVILGDRCWPIRSYLLAGDPLVLHSVLAEEPPEFGWWMPSIKGLW